MSTPRRTRQGDSGDDPGRISSILPTVRPLRRYFTERVDPLTNLFLVLPLFIVYHIGVLIQARRGPDGNLQWVGNGVDFLTGTALSLVHGDVLMYAVITSLVTIVLMLLILRARRSAKLHPKLFLPVLVESTVYALLIAGTIGYVVDALGLGVLDSEGFIAQVVGSCGAGLHEELIFRMALFGGSGYLLAKRMRPWAAWLIALVTSSLFFSAVHYLGPLGDRFSVSSFAFRAFCGVAFALIYRFRGFALAAWTHALYDIFYFTLKHS